MPTFSLFPLLPTELRLQIWRFTVEPRTVDISVSESYLRFGYPLPVTNTPVPGPLQTCRESRSELQKHYQRGFKELRNRDDVELRYVWVNFEIDIIYIGSGNHFHVYKAVASQIQRLKFDGDLSDESFCRGGMIDLLLFTSVKEVFVVYMDNRDMWWGIQEEYEWPFDEDSAWFIDPDNGKKMRSSELDAMCLQEARVQNAELGEDYETGLPLGVARLFRRAMRRRVAALSRQRAMAASVSESL